MKNPHRFLPLLLAVIAALFFFRTAAPDTALFSNDLPLGVINARFYNDVSTVQGTWSDVNWVGVPLVAAPLSAHTLLVFALGSVGYAKFAGLISTILLGLSGWFYFRRTGFEPWPSFLGGLALMLNLSFFCFTCWGVFAWNLAIAFAMVALAIIHQEKYTFKDLLLAGLCIGMCVNDGTDVGAILAAFIGVYYIFHNAWKPRKQWLAASVQLGVIVLLSLLVSANRIYSLVATQLKPTSAAATTPTAEEKQAEWDFITQWSLPKQEIATMLVPGLFGYRMDTPDGGNYWGEVGRGPGSPRSTGGSQYAGKLVLLVGVFAGLAALFLRPRGSARPIPFERRELIFWSVVCLITVTLMFGKHFFTFKLLYALPFFSSIRNTGKYCVPMMIGLVILFGHGLRLLSSPTEVENRKRLLRLFLGVSAVFVVAHVGLLAFWSSGQEKIRTYLLDNSFDPTTSRLILEFSRTEIVISLFVLLITIALAGYCLRVSNRTSLLVALGVVLVVDLGYADHFWLNYYNYKARNASNALFDFLREKPHEHRVTGPKPPGGAYFLLPQQLQGFAGIYYEWMQNPFQYYNIQTPDITQWPRMPEMDRKFGGAFGPQGTADGKLDVVATLQKSSRFWQLSNTRYVIASLAGLDFLQRNLGQDYQYGLVQAFNLVPNGNYYTTISSTNGPFALLEFSNALPRVKFYSRWRNEPDEAKALATVAGREFDPTKEVVVLAADVPGMKPTEADTTAAAKITDYSPKHYTISATNAAPGVLLLNSRYEPNWRVIVDGQPQPLLRCNYIMSGVALPAGKHDVVFRFAPNPLPFWVNLVSLLVVLGLVAVPLGRKTPAGTVAPKPAK